MAGPDPAACRAGGMLWRFCQGPLWRARHIDAEMALTG